MDRPEIVQEDHLLSDYSSWKVGGLAQYFAAPSSLEELKEVLHWAREENLELTILSGGTNVLISDEGVPGLTLGMSNLNGTEVIDDGEFLKMETWAGSAKGELLKIFLKYKLAPGLFLTGLPGDVGGGVVMNAGINENFDPPREFCEIVSWVEVMSWSDSENDFVVKRHQASDLKWRYRHCDGWQPGVIVKVGVEWPNKPVEGLLDKVRAASRDRLSKQPLNFPSCGSVFRNPEGHKSGKLIEDCGLKGYRVGGAEVSTKHSNFIINTENAKASDIHAVIEHVKGTVKEMKGVDLQTEVVYLGMW